MGKIIKLLKDLYCIHSPTGHEWKLICFIREYVSKNVPEVEVQIDSWGNMYIKKGESGAGFPILACHLDQVQTLHSEDFEVKDGLGADDKNGIWICLRCLQDCPRLKVFMAVGEEKGCIGSNRADMSFFADSLYVLEPDCKGGEEIHTVLRGIRCASLDFERALQEIDTKYTIMEGKTSDILALTINGIGVSCANIPVGYHQPHKDDEYTVISELEHALTFIRHFITIERRRFPHTYKTYTQQMIEENLYPRQ